MLQKNGHDRDEHFAGHIIEQAHQGQDPDGSGDDLYSYGWRGLQVMSLA